MILDTKKGFTLLNPRYARCSPKANNLTGYTLMEILIYITVSVILVLVLTSFFLWAIRLNTKTKALREVTDNTRRAMEVITYEIREARNIYAPTTSSTQLSLETSRYLPAQEETSFIDFYICGTQLCLKKEGVAPIALTSDRVEIKNLVFLQIATNSSTTSSVQVNLNMGYKNPQNRPELEASINSTTTASLRVR